MLSQFGKTIKRALKFTQKERQLLRARSAVQRFPVSEWCQCTEDFHKRSINASSRQGSVGHLRHAGRFRCEDHSPPLCACSSGPHSRQPLRSVDSQDQYWGQRAQRNTHMERCLHPNLTHTQKRYPDCRSEESCRSLEGWIHSLADDWPLTVRRRWHYPWKSQQP